MKYSFRKCSDSVRNVCRYLCVCMRRWIGSDVKLHYEARKAKPVRKCQILSKKVQCTISLTSSVKNNTLFHRSCPALLGASLVEQEPLSEGAAFQ